MIKIIGIVNESRGGPKDGTGGRELKHPANFGGEKKISTALREPQSRAEALPLQPFMGTGSFLGYKDAF